MVNIHVQFVKEVAKIQTGKKLAVVIVERQLNTMFLGTVFQTCVLNAGNFANSNGRISRVDIVDQISDITLHGLIFLNFAKSVSCGKKNSAKVVAIL
jgi:hypothetical protein